MVVGMIKKSTQGNVVLNVGFILAFLLLVTQAVAQTPTSGVAETVDLKEVEGKVVLITPNMITIEFARTQTGSTEIVIPLDETAQLNHLQNIQDIQQGDIVKVVYKETYVLDAEGRRTNFKRLATDISLVKQATQGLISIGQ
jgi:hypothetical protein